MSENNGRDNGGRFAEGNGGGPGRPRREKEAAYLAATVAAVPVADWTDIVVQAVADAKSGDHHARGWLSKVLGLDAPQKVANTDGDGGRLTFAAILAAATRSEPPGEEHTSNVVDVDAEVARIRAEYLAEHGHLPEPPATERRTA